MHNETKREYAAWEAGYTACWAVFSSALVQITSGVPAKMVLNSIEKPRNPYE